MSYSGYTVCVLFSASRECIIRSCSVYNVIDILKQWTRCFRSITDLNTIQRWSYADIDASDRNIHLLSSYKTLLRRFYYSERGFVI